MALQFVTDEAKAIECWSLDRHLYAPQARSLFAGNPKFIELDLTHQPNWPQRLGQLIRDAGIAFDQPTTTTVQNKRDINPSRRELLEKYFALIDARIEQMSERHPDIEH